MRRERGLRSVSKRFLRQRMRQGLEGGIVLEREVHAFVRLDEHEDARIVIWRCAVGRGGIEREPVRIREARGVALPVGERRDVVGFAGHGEAETMENRNAKFETLHRIAYDIRRTNSTTERRRKRDERERNRDQDGGRRAVRTTQAGGAVRSGGRQKASRSD